jgi:hypothetical protein
MPWSSKWSLSFGLSHQNLVHFSLLSHAWHLPRQPHSPWLYLPNDIWGWRPTPRLENHPLAAVRDCLFNKFAANLHIWRSSPLSATLGRAMPWWQWKHLTWAALNIGAICFSKMFLSLYNSTRRYSTEQHRRDNSEDRCHSNTNTELNFLKKWVVTTLTSSGVFPYLCFDRTSLASEGWVPGLNCNHVPRRRWTYDLIKSCIKSQAM